MVPKAGRSARRLADLRAFMRHRSREQLIGAALAILVTMIIVIEFLVDSKINTAPPPQVVYADSWTLNRPTPRSSPSRRSTRQSATPRRRKSSASSRNSRSSSGCERRRAFHGRSGAARRGRAGRSAPNPNVGCVIVSANGEIVGRGATAPGGRPHAEAVALEQAGGKAKAQRSTSRSSPARTTASAARRAPTFCSRRSRRGS